VKSFLGFAHRVGFTRVNAAPLIKLKRAPRQLAQRIMGEVEVRMLIRAAKPGRDRLLLEVAYFGALRVSELVSLTWSQVIRRDSGEAQLSIIGKGDKAREVLFPAAIASPLLASRGDAPAGAPVFASVRRPGQPLTERAVRGEVNTRAFAELVVKPARGYRHAAPQHCESLRIDRINSALADRGVGHCRVVARYVRRRITAGYGAHGRALPSHIGWARHTAFGSCTHGVAYG
jgi:integrase/recombinase XerD